jgi:hypothetical protein
VRQMSKRSMKRPPYSPAVIVNVPPATGKAARASSRAVAASRIKKGGQPMRRPPKGRTALTDRAMSDGTVAVQRRLLL